MGDRNPQQNESQNQRNAQDGQQGQQCENPSDRQGGRQSGDPGRTRPYNEGEQPGARPVDEEQRVRERESGRQSPGSIPQDDEDSDDAPRSSDGDGMAEDGGR